MGFQIMEQVVNAARRKLLVQYYIPVYYPNLYITMEHSGRALETTKKYLEHLAVLEGFLDFSSIDLISRLEQRPHSQYLTDNELSRFVSDAGFSKETLAMKYAGIRLHPTAYRSVGKAHAQQRIEAVRDYLGFLYDKMGDHSTRYEAVDDLKKRINRKITAARPAWKKTRMHEMKGLTSQERTRLLEVMHPYSRSGIQAFQYGFDGHRYPADLPPDMWAYCEISRRLLECGLPMLRCKTGADSGLRKPGIWNSGARPILVRKACFRSRQARALSASIELSRVHDRYEVSGED